MPTLTPPPPITKGKPATPKLQRRQPAALRIAGACLWTALSVVAVIAGLELVFRAAHIGEEEIVQVTPVMGFWHRPNQLVTWRSEGYSQGSTNADGMRDVAYTTAKPAGTTRIAVLGDSMTEGLQVPLNDTFVKQLERGLNGVCASHCQVMNFGMSGYSTVQELYLFKEKIAAYKPDICILAYHVGDSDKNYFLAPTDAGLPRPYCLLSPAGTLSTDWHHYDNWLHSPQAGFYRQSEFLRRNSRIWAVATAMDLQLSRLQWYGRVKQLLLQAAASKTATLPAPRCTDTGADVASRSLHFAPTLPVTAAPVRATFAMPPYRPKLMKEVAGIRALADNWGCTVGSTAAHFTITEAVVEALQQACRANHCQLVLAALPAPNNSMFYFRELPRLRKLAARDGFDFVDVNAVFPSLAPMQDSPLYFQIHYTSQGHALVASCLQGYLLSNKLVR